MLCVSIKEPWRIIKYDFSDGMLKRLYQDYFFKIHVMISFFNYTLKFINKKS